MTMEELQNAIIDAVEKARSRKIAAGVASPAYDIGYNEAKRDVLIELTSVMVKAEQEGVR